MAWQQLIVHLEAAELPKAEALLRLAGAEALSLHGDDDSELLEPAPGETPLWQRVSLRALFGSSADITSVVRVLRSSLSGQPRVTTHSLSEEDWSSARQGAFEAQRIGRLLLTPADHEPNETDGVRLALNMGLAFGTGRHPTTRLCLQWLEAHLRPGARVLDYGAGSGVLALAALILGAERAWAVDIDPQALTAAADNARLNGLTERLWIGTPEAFAATSAADADVDVVVANILAGPLQDLAEPLARYLMPEGAVILSGLLERQCDAMEAAFRPYFCDFKRTVQEGWARIDATRCRGDG